MNSQSIMPQRIVVGRVQIGLKTSQWEFFTNQRGLVSKIFQPLCPFYRLVLSGNDLTSTDHSAEWYEITI